MEKEETLKKLLAFVEEKAPKNLKAKFAEAVNEMIEFNEAAPEIEKAFDEREEALNKIGRSIKKLHKTLSDHRASEHRAKGPDSPS